MWKQLGPTMGSSPHARGKPDQSGIYRAGSRLIPACAGKTAASENSFTRAAAHPRMRGENTRNTYRRPGTRGSSPHARGKPQATKSAHDHGRLIPACAGKTTAPTARATTRAAHPRMRGENTRNTYRRPGTRGSSPHARGKRSDVRGRDCGRRLIPACAGKTSTAFIVHCSIKAHPRMRGENGAWDKRHSRGLGSSPHARGKRVYPAIL